mgnify:CR=1 FL=1
MKIFRSILAVAAALLAPALAFAAKLLTGPVVIRARTCDVAFPYRMGAGFPGDVNRTHPASIFPVLTDTTDVIAAYGNPVLNKTSNNTVKGFVAADTTTPVLVAGFAVRPYPTQQMSGGAGATIGAAVPPTSGVVDILEDGYIMSKLPAGASVTRGGAVYVWFAATSGNNIQGGLVASATGGSTALITNAKFNGPADASGNVEVRVWRQG